MVTSGVATRATLDLDFTADDESESAVHVMGTLTAKERLRRDDNVTISLNGTPTRCAGPRIECADARDARQEKGGTPTSAALAQDRSAGARTPAAGDAPSFAISGIAASSRYVKCA